MSLLGKIVAHSWETPRPAGTHRDTQASGTAPRDQGRVRGHLGRQRGGTRCDPHTRSARPGGESRSEAPSRPSLDPSPRSTARSRGRGGCEREARVGGADGTLQPASPTAPGPAPPTWETGGRGERRAAGGARRGHRSTHQGSRAYSSILTRARERRRESGAGPEPEAEVTPEEGGKACGDWLAASETQPMGARRRGAGPAHVPQAAGVAAGRGSPVSSPRGARGPEGSAGSSR